MIEVVPLRYGTVFKKAFGKPEIFNEFVKAATGVAIHVSEVFQEYEYKEPIGNVKIKYDLFAEDPQKRVIVEIQHIRESDFWDRFLSYHMMAMIEQARSSEDYRMTKDVYTIVVLTTTPKDKSMDFSMAVSELDPIIQDADRKGQKAEVYRHKLVFLNPKQVSEKTPEPIRGWLELIKDTLDSQVDERSYQNSLFQKIIREITKTSISPEEAARIKDDAAWERTKQEAREEGRIEGIKEGEIKATLEIKFGDRGLAWMDKIRTIQDLAKLNQILTLAKKAKTLAEFESGLGM